MYEVDQKDRVLPLEGVPQSSVGAPIPFVIADEHRIVLAYYTDDDRRPWTGGTPRIVRPTGSDEPIAIIRFYGYSHIFGPPNDEAFAGHPLAGRGLEPYGAFVVENSSWIRKLERMNSVHPYHRPERYKELRHLIFSFHDPTFECVCRRFDVTTTRGTIHDAIPKMVGLLEWERTA